MKDIRGYEGLYAATEDGKIWSYRSQRFLQPSTSQKGYLRVNLRRDNKLVSFPAHRLIAETFVSGREADYEVNHKNGVKTDNRADNLEWLSQRDNVRHAWNTGLCRDRAKSVMCIDTGESFPSAASASRSLGLSDSAVASAIRQESRTGGYRWSYA